MSPITTPKQFMDLGRALAYLTSRNKPLAVMDQLQEDTLTRKERMDQFKEERDAYQKSS